jgi:hypothetical protein
MSTHTAISFLLGVSAGNGYGDHASAAGSTIGSTNPNPLLGFEEAEFTIAVNGEQISVSDPVDYVSQDLSEDSWECDAEFVLHINGKAFTYNS